MAQEDAMLSAASAAQPKRCVVRPTVLASVCDAFVRRPAPEADAAKAASESEKPKKSPAGPKAAARAAARAAAEAEALRLREHDDVIHGVLLGVKHGGQFIIEDSFAVPRLPRSLPKDAGEDAGDDDRTYGLNQRYVWKMLELHRRVNPKYVAVGWYTAGPFSNPEVGKPLGVPAALMHEFFMRQLRRAPINVVVDTSLANGKLDVRAYSGSAVVLAGSPIGTQFLPVPLSITAAPEEDSALEALLRAAETNDHAASLPRPHDAFVLALENLLATVRKLKDHADQAGADADPSVGRAIAEALDAVPTFPEPQMSKLVDASTQDHMMVVYLANMARAQVKLAEKLAAVVV